MVGHWGKKTPQLLLNAQSVYQRLSGFHLAQNNAAQHDLSCIRRTSWSNTRDRFRLSIFSARHRPRATRLQRVGMRQRPLNGVDDEEVGPLITMVEKEVGPVENSYEDDGHDEDEEGEIEDRLDEEQETRGTTQRHRLAEFAT